MRIPGALLLAVLIAGGCGEDEDALDEASQGLTVADLAWPTSPPPGPVITPRSNIVASGAAGAQSEADIAVDPTNVPYYNHLIAASNDESSGHVRVYESWDGATSWKTQSVAPPGGGFGGVTRHPSVAYDAAGDAFVSVLAYDTSGASNRIALTRRLSGQSGFSAYTIANASSADRQRLTVDRSSVSPRAGWIYLAWSDGQAVYVASSHDGGASFSTGTRISDGGHATSPYPMLARDGTLYVAWLDPVRGQLLIDRSPDGGLTWGTDHLVHALGLTGVTASTPAAPVAGARLAPFCDVDRSSGPRRGTIYCAYTDRAGSNGLDVFLRRSIDGGATWSPARRMSDEAAGTWADQLLPRVQVDDTSGKVNVGWYDTRNDPAHRKTDVYFTRASDGVSFVPAARVTGALSDESRSGADAAAYGEALGMEAYLGRVRVLWTDSRSGDEEIDSCIIDFAHFSFFFGGSATRTIPVGGTSTMTVRVDPVGPFAAPVTLSVLHLPTGATASFVPNPVLPGGVSTLMLRAGSALRGTYAISLKGKGGGEEGSRAMTMVVQ
jgi:hypothetical protein